MFINVKIVLNRNQLAYIAQNINLECQLVSNMLINIIFNLTNNDMNHERQTILPDLNEDNCTITPGHYNIPTKIEHLRIKQLSWNDFQGKINPQLPYSAHIYWRIEYQINKNKHGTNSVIVDVKILPKSWVLKQNKSQHLLKHQYGHYLIGCLCALSFQKKVNHTLKMPINTMFKDWCAKVFRQTLDEYLKLQKLYDEQTNHRLNFHKQSAWQKLIAKQLMSFKQQKKKNKQQSNYKFPRIKSHLR